VHHPQTEQRLRAKACEFHRTVREDTDTQDHVQDTSHTQDGALKDFTVEDEHQVEEEQQVCPGLACLNIYIYIYIYKFASI